MRRFAVCLLVLSWLLALPAAASAAGWSSVPLPRHTGLSAVTCVSTGWCDAVGGWGNKLELGHWNGKRWSVSTKLPDPRGATLSGIACRSTRSCVAVGQVFAHEDKPINPLIERWDGRHWRVQTVPKPAPPKGYRGVNTRLYAVSCPGNKFCFAVGQAVPFGAGNAPGTPLIERWDGHHWHLVAGATGASSPLDSISCTSTRACTAVGAFEHEVGTPEANNQQVEYPNTVERWNGRNWSLGSLRPPLSPGGGGVAGLLGVSCTARLDCLGVGSAFEAGPASPVGSDAGTDQAIAAPGDGTAFSAGTLGFPPSVYRTPSSGSPRTVLTAVACSSEDPDSCGAVGDYTATNGAIGPLAAFWNGSSWAQVALRRGPVALSSVSCPALGWCMAVGSTVAERFR